MAGIGPGPRREDEERDTLSVDPFCDAHLLAVEKSPNASEHWH